MSRQNRTFIDGTAICPACKKQMELFPYTKSHVSDVSSSKTWELGKTTTYTQWKETEYSKGLGYMCMSCYRKRQIRFWVIAAVVIAAIVVCIAVGLRLGRTPMIVGGMLSAVVLFWYTVSKEKKLYDIQKAMGRYIEPESEFAFRFVSEHPEQFLQPTDIIAVQKRK